ncbi:hypothetical protein EMIT0P228_20665 [Pseudomonas brassicacearum]
MPTAEDEMPSALPASEKLRVSAARTKKSIPLSDSTPGSHYGHFFRCVAHSSILVSQRRGPYRSRHLSICD